MDSHQFDIRGEIHKIPISGIGMCELIVPETVYPPKEDSLLLCKAISRLEGEAGNALEIGCGSGAVSIQLASLGWKVKTCDVNPIAVSATIGNVRSHGLSGCVEVFESGIGEGMEIPEGTDLVVWNIPYLDEVDDATIDAIESAALNDIGNGGWSRTLLNFLEESSCELKDNLLVMLLMRTDPLSESKASDWKKFGWSSRSIEFERLGGERIDVICFWKTGQGIKPRILEKCDSTMDEAKKIESSGWQRVFSHEQRNGRGRKSSRWSSNEGGLFATWCLSEDLLTKIAPGALQTGIGSIIANDLGVNTKWPNDIIGNDGNKVGGVLVESSDGGPIRVGVGVNRHNFEDDGVTGSGWEETLGPIGAEEIFQSIDTSISSFFEDTGNLPMPSAESVISMAWNSLSKSLSHGAMAHVGGELIRPIGINMNGELETLGSGGIGVVNDLDTVEWLF